MRKSNLGKKRVTRVLRFALLVAVVIGASGTLALASTGGTGSAFAEGENVELVGQIGGACYAVAVEGNYAYIGEGRNLGILDVSHPENAKAMGKVLTSRFCAVLGCLRPLAYVADGDSLQIIDVSNPAGPVLMGSYSTPSYAYGVFVSGSLAYVADGGGLQVIDVSNPAAPVLMGSYDTPGTARGIFVSGSLAYVADGDGGLAILRYTGEQPDTPTPTETPTDTPTLTASPTEITPEPTATETPNSDLNGDGRVDAVDLLLLMKQWHKSAPTEGSTDTPTDTLVSTVTNTAASSLTDTPTDTPTNTATDAPTDTPTPLLVSFTSWARNSSLPATCAEHDNINIPIFGRQVERFEIIASHPTYCPCVFDGCPPDRSGCIYEPGVGVGATDVCTEIYNDHSKNVIRACTMPAWWQDPRAMDVEVGSATTTAHYLVWHQRIGSTSWWPEFFVLYQDGNMRLKPHPPEGVADVCYGTSVIVGPAAPAERPYVDIQKVIVNPGGMSLQIFYRNGETADVNLSVDRNRASAQVSVGYQAGQEVPFATFQSMWVSDTTCDAARIEGATGDLPILGDWFVLEGPYWVLGRTQLSGHNTSAPDVRIEILE
jgi:hypothetical protein